MPNTRPDIVDAVIVSETPHPQTQQPKSPDEPQVIDLNAIPKTRTARSFQDQFQHAAASGAFKAVQSAIHNATQPRPTWAFARQSSAHLIALGFGSGLMRPAPGTWGTLFGWLTFNYLLANLSSYTQGLIILTAFMVGVWACGAAGKALGVIDHGAWVWDEVVAFWCVLWLIPHTFTAQLWAFILFRLFDIIKPPPIRQWDAQLKNGFGVMWDDIVAAAYTLLVIALWHRLF